MKKQPGMLPSERAWMYRREMEMRSRQGYRSDLPQALDEDDWEPGQNTAEIVGEEYGESKSQVARYIRLTYLIDPLLDLVDSGVIKVGVGVQLSYLSQQSQEAAYNICYRSEPIRELSEAQAKELRAAEATPNKMIDEALIDSLFEEREQGKYRSIVLSMAELQKYFPLGTPSEEVKGTILTLLEERSNGKT